MFKQFKEEIDFAGKKLTLETGKIARQADGAIIATYGETMDVNYKVPVTNEQSSTTVNLPALLDSFRTLKITDTAKTKSGFTFKVAPLDYQLLTKIQVAQFEQQKIYATVSASAVSQETRSKQFAESFQKLNTINFELLIDSITSITTPENKTVTDKKAITDFINNCEAKIVNEIQDELGKVRTQAQIKPLQMKATEEQIKKGVPATYEVPVTFDSSNFFG